MKLSGFSILSPREQQTFSRWNHTDVTWERVCVPELFERQVLATPDAAACHDMRGSLTYAQLNRRANQLAHHLRSAGVGPEVRVALFVERSCDFVVGLMGIFKAGGCVIPLDPQYPSAYLQRIMADARPQWIVTSADLQESIAGGTALPLRVDDPALAQQPQSNTLSGLQPEHLAHVMYTSGSTGQPKGVMVPHWQITNWLHALWERMPFTADDMVAQKTSAAFAVSVKELLAGLLTGVPQVLLPDEVVKDTAAFAAALEQWRVTRLNIVPSHLQSLLSHLGNDTKALASLTCCVTAGEPLTQALRAEMRQKLPWVRLWNNYGCTELNDVTYWDAQEQGNDGTFASIGRPIANTRVFVLDTMLRQVPVGVMGELCVESIGMARGYWQQPGLTAERFIPNPFSTRPGARLYRTGDMVRYLSDGSLEYLGRHDFEIKIRGHRIDVRQVERALKEHTAIEQAVVSAWPRNSVAAKLVAYVVMAKSETLPADVLRKHLSECLPAYMVPSLYIALDAFPRLPNGKLNRMGLPAPDAALMQTSEYVAPETEIEEKLCDIWQTLLGLEKVSVLDNFFSIGGDSISSAKMAAQAKRIGIPLIARQLFEHQTIRELALHATARHGQAAQERTEGGQLLTPAHHRFLSEVGMQDAHCFNHSVLLRPPLELTEAALRTIVDALYQRHDALRLRWSLTDEGWQAVYVPFDAGMMENSFAVEHLHGNTEEERLVRIEQINQQTRAELSAGGVLMRMIYLKASGDESRLLVVLHRMVADETSLRILLRDIEQACRQLLLEQAIRLPPKTSSYREWGDFLHAAMEQSSLRQEKDYWLEQLNTVTDTLPATADTKARHDGRREKTVQVSLSRAYTAALLKDCPDAFRADIDVLLLAGLMTSFHRWAEIGNVRVRMETDGREKAGDRLNFGETAGCFTVAYPLVLHCSNPESASRVIEEVRTALDGVPGGGIGFGLLKYSLRDEAVFAADDRCRDDILFSYCGARDAEFVAGPAFQRDGGSLHSGTQPHDPKRYALSLHAAVIDSRMSLSLGYCESRFSEAAMEQLAADMQGALQALIERGHASVTQSYTPASHALPDALESDSVCRYHPLPANRHWYFTRRTKDLQAWGSCIGLQFSDTADHTAAVAKTTGYLQKAHAGLRLQLIRENDRWFERVADAGSVDIFHVEDLSSLPEPRKEIEFDRKFSAYRDSIELSESLFKVVYFRMGEQRQDRIVLVTHHLAIDQYSSDILMHDFDELLSAIESGRPFALKPVDDSISEWARAQRQWANSDRAESALMHWLQHDFSRFGKLPVDFEHAAEANSIGSSVEVTRRLSAEETGAFLSFAKGNGSFTMLDALLTATVEAFQRWSGKRSLCVELVDSGRDSVMQEMDVSGTIGWLNEFVPIFIDLGAAGKGEESLQSAARSIALCMKHGKGFNALKYHSDDASVREKLAGVIEPEVAINFIPPTLGQASRKPSDCGKLTFARWEPMDGAGRERVHLLGCEIAFDDGQLRFSWNFSRNVYRQSTVEHLADCCVAELTSLVRMMSEQRNDEEADACTV